MFCANQQIPFCWLFKKMYYNTHTHARTRARVAILENIHQRSLKGKNAITKYYLNFIAVVPSNCLILMTNITKHFCHLSGMGDTWCPTHNAKTSSKVFYKRGCTGMCMCDQTVKRFSSKHFCTHSPFNSNTQTV